MHPATSFRRPAILLLAAAVLAGSGMAQQPPAAPSAKPSFKKPTQEVMLPVTIRDKHGDLVPNLTAADFTLTEDGRPQTIKSFSAQSDLPLQLGILVDTSQPVQPAIPAERAAAQKFVGQMLPADASSSKTSTEAFLIHFDNEVELLHDFTNSRDKLNRELQTLGPTTAQHRDPRGPETNDSGPYNTAPTASHGGTQVYDAIYLASNELMKPKTGRKVLVLFSDGVDRSSKETQSDAIDAAERADTVVYSIYFRGGDERQSGFPGLGRHGGGYPGGGYPGTGPGYPGGGYPGGDPGGGGYPGQGRTERAPIDGKKVMQDIATRTGGQFFEAKRTANIEEIYNQIAKELQGQYVLTYVPDKADNEGGYHKIVLKPKDDKYIVTTRTGFYAPGGDSK